MTKRVFSAIVGFTVLFVFYHAAEYMIVFKNSAPGFLMFQLAFFIAAWLIGKWQYGTALSAWGLDLKKRWTKHLLIGMVMGVLLYGLTFLISIFLGIERITAYPSGSDMPSLLLFIFGSFFSSFSEDILTRGYVYKHLKGKFRSPSIVLISAIVYLFNHIYRLGDGFDTYLYLLLLGVLFAIPLILTDRLWFTGGLHWAGNISFFFTHQFILTEDLNQKFSSNYIFSGVIILMIPPTYYLLKKLTLIKRTTALTTKNL